MIKLEYPVSSPTLEVELPNPQFGDTVASTYSNVFGKNRNGELLNVYDANHPAQKVRVWAIRKMSWDQRNDLEEFLKASAGDLIKVTHYDSTTFNALITNETLEYITVRDDCNYEITLQLMEIS